MIVGVHRVFLIVSQEVLSVLQFEIIIFGSKVVLNIIDISQNCNIDNELMFFYSTYLTRH